LPPAILNHRRGQRWRSLESRTQLYHLVHEMRRSALSYRRMQAKIFDESGTNLSRSSISYWLTSMHHPSGSLNRFDAKPCPELSYVIGVALSDGNVNTYEYDSQIMLSVTDRDFAEEFSRCLARVLGRRTAYKVRWSEKRERWIVQGCSVLLYSFLCSNLSHLGRWIEHCDKCKSVFLRAFYDPKTGKTYFRKNDCFRFSIRARSLLPFNQSIGFTIERKQTRLSQAILEIKQRSLL
jgi:intein-encoded DNA endonuclease-like protein